MDFFREPIPNESNRSLTPQQEGSAWQKDEGRRRIAFGMLRTDVYTSVLLSTRPLVTPEEVKLTFPRSDALWMNSEHLTAEGRLSRQREEDSQSLQMPFSDIVRIFLDRNEPKPELSPVGYELVLFGLQEAVWRFSHDAELFPRLTGACLGDTLFPPTTNPSLDHKPPPTTSNSHSHRRMLDLHNDHARLIAALDSWSSAVNTALASGAYTAHRDTLMSSLLLYRLSMLRLAAPLEDLHHISYRAASPPTVSQRILSKTTAWTRSRFCPEAAQQAWDVKTLIEQELLRPQSEQARFNFLAFCSLHHAAVVLWTVAAMRDLLPKSTAKVPKDRDVQSFLNECPRLFSLLSPLGGNSFEASAYRLQACRFPRAAE